MASSDRPSHQKAHRGQTLSEHTVQEFIIFLRVGLPFFAKAKSTSLARAPFCTCTLKQTRVVPDIFTCSVWHPAHRPVSRVPLQLLQPELLPVCLCLPLLELHKSLAVLGIIQNLSCGCLVYFLVRERKGRFFLAGGVGR